MTQCIFLQRAMFHREYSFGDVSKTEVKEYIPRDYYQAELRPQESLKKVREVQEFFNEKVRASERLQEAKLRMK